MDVQFQLGKLIIIFNLKLKRILISESQKAFFRTPSKMYIACLLLSQVCISKFGHGGFEALKLPKPKQIIKHYLNLLDLIHLLTRGSYIMPIYKMEIVMVKNELNVED